MAADTRTGIVTGGSGGIGQVPAERLARHVRVVIAHSGNRSRAEEVVVATGAAGGDTAAFRADVSNGDEAAKLFDIADTVRVRKPVAQSHSVESGSVVAELELELGRERRSAAREARPARGQAIGRPKALDNSKTALAQRMHTSGEAASTIAATLGVSRATVYRALAEQD